MFHVSDKTGHASFPPFYTLANQILLIEPVNWWFNVICCLSARDRRLNGRELAGKIDGCEKIKGVFLPCAPFFAFSPSKAYHAGWLSGHRAIVENKSPLSKLNNTLTGTGAITRK